MTSERLRKAKDDLLLLAPGPINRGVELTPEVADGPHSAILDQVTNGLAVRMAVLYLLVRPAGTIISACRLAASVRPDRMKPMQTIQITNGRVIDPAQDIDQVTDLWIRGEHIVGIGPQPELQATRGRSTPAA